MKAYIVYASTGYGQDYMTSKLMAYTDEADALDHMRKATEFAKLHGVHDSQSGISYEQRDKFSDIPNPYHPNPYVDHSGVEYDVQEIDLASSLDEGLAILAES